MWKQILLIVVSIVIVAMTVKAIPICEDRVNPNVACTMVTPALTCSSIYSYDVINASNGNIVVFNNTLTPLNQSVYSFKFNQSTGDYVARLCDNSTRQVRVVAGGADGPMNFELSILWIGIAAILFFVMRWYGEKKEGILKNLFEYGGAVVILLTLFLAIVTAV